MRRAGGNGENPFGYDLKRFPEANAQRREVVLKRMVDCGNLSEEARQAALKEDVQAWRDTGEDTGDSSDDQYQSYFTDAVIRQVLADLQSELGYSKNMALQLLYSGGLKIVTTVDPDIQAKMDAVFQDEENFPGGLGSDGTYPRPPWC